MTLHLWKRREKLRKGYLKPQRTTQRTKTTNHRAPHWRISPSMLDPYFAKLSAKALYALESWTTITFKNDFMMLRISNITFVKIKRNSKKLRLPTKCFKEISNEDLPLMSFRELQSFLWCDIFKIIQLNELDVNYRYKHAFVT